MWTCGDGGKTQALPADEPNKPCSIPLSSSISFVFSSISLDRSSHTDSENFVKISEKNFQSTVLRTFLHSFRVPYERTHAPAAAPLVFILNRVQPTFFSPFFSPLFLPRSFLCMITASVSISLSSTHAQTVSAYFLSRLVHC